MDANKIDVDALFKQYTIKEIQAIELQVKNEIEKKKEDLRIMVYNRYRDIIDAADGIHIMKSYSKKIETVLSELQGTCDTVFNSKESQRSTDQVRQQKSIEKTTRNNKYVLAVIIKILQNSPSKIWYHLDNAEYTKAAKQYLLAQHAHICLELEPSLKALANSASHIQYANELWSSIVFLSRTIAVKARDVFTDLNVNSARTLTNAMSAIYLLETSSLKAIFNEFLKERTPMIKSVIHINPKEQSNTVSIKERILKCLKSFVDTVNHIYNLFSDDIDNKSQSFEDCINDSAFTIESLKDDGFLIAKIPAYLKNMKFKDTTDMKRFEKEYLIDQANSWLAGCSADLHQGLEYTFKYVKSLKNLVEIRDFVIDFEATIKQDSGSHANWMHVCQVLFSKEILIWSQLISPFYYAQTKFVIESVLKTTHETLIKSLKDSLSDKLFVPNDAKTLLPETDINSYIWSLENSQLTSLINSQKNTKQKSFDLLFSRSFSSSQLKATGNTNQHNVTPAIKDLCKQLDDELEYLLEDIEHTTKWSVKNRIPSMKSIITEDFDRCNDYLEQSLKEFSRTVCQSLIDLIEMLRGQEGGKERIKKILLICRFTNALVNVSCPNLKATFKNVNQQVIKQRKSQLEAKLSDTNDLMQMLSAAKKKSILAEQKILDQKWVQFTDELQGICKVGFKVWIESLCKDIKDNYLSDSASNAIESIPNKSGQQLLAINDLVAWDEIEIEDELGTEEEEEEVSTDKKAQVVEESTKSKLHAPLVCSPTIQTVLYTLCQELCKNLSYNMIDTNLIIRDLVINVFELILEYYTLLAAKSQGNRLEQDTMPIKLTQNQSLQMLFDIRFLYSLFDIKSFVLSAERSRMSRIQTDYKQLNSDLEALIDPFDYDICSPFIQSNITKSIGRTAALYGILNTNSRFGRTTAGSTALTTANDKFNLVVLSDNQHRFELLPLPSQQSQQQLNLEKQQNQLLKNQAASLKYEASKPKMSSTRAQLADSASTGLSNVLKWFQ